MQTYEASPGVHVSKAIAEMIDLATTANDSVASEFNGVDIVVKPGEDAASVEKAYDLTHPNVINHWKMLNGTLLTEAITAARG